jgi:hypothetical protein
MCTQLIISFYLLCTHDTYYVHIHAIGFPEEVTLLKFEVENQEVQPQEDQGEGE